MSFRILKRDRSKSHSLSPSNSGSIDDLISLFGKTTIKPTRKKIHKDVDVLGNLLSNTFLKEKNNRTIPKQKANIIDLTRVNKRKPKNSLEELTDMFNKSNIDPKKNKRNIIDLTGVNERTDTFHKRNIDPKTKKRNRQVVENKSISKNSLDDLVSLFEKTTFIPKKKKKKNETSVFHENIIPLHTKRIRKEVKRYTDTDENKRQKELQKKHNLKLRSTQKSHIKPSIKTKKKTVKIKENNKNEDSLDFITNRLGKLRL